MYPFLVQPAALPFIRFYGPFDEPGVVGTICGLMLCINRMNFRDYKSIILLVAGLLSLSLYFFIVIGVYSIFHFAFVKKSITSTIMMILFIFGVYLVVVNTPILNETIGERFLYDED